MERSFEFDANFFLSKQIPPTPSSTPNSVTPTTPSGLASSNDVGTPTSYSPTSGARLYTPRSFMVDRVPSTASSISPSTPIRTRPYALHSSPSSSPNPPAFLPSTLVSMSASSSSTSLASSTSTPSKILSQSQWIYRKPKSPSRPAGLGSTASIFGSTSTLSTTASHQQQHQQQPQQVSLLSTQSNTWSAGDTSSQNSCGNSSSACLGGGGNGSVNGHHTTNRDQPHQTVSSNNGEIGLSQPQLQQQQAPQKSSFLNGVTRSMSNNGFGSTKSGSVLGNGNEFGGIGIASSSLTTTTTMTTDTTMVEIGTPTSPTGSTFQSPWHNHVRSNSQPDGSSTTTAPATATAPSSPSSAPPTPSSAPSSNMFWSSILRPRTRSERTVPLLNLKNKPSIQVLQPSLNSSSSSGTGSGSFGGGLFTFKGSTPASPTKENTGNKEDGGDVKDKGNPLISSPKPIQHMRTPSITSSGSSASSSSSSRPHTPNSASLGHGFGLGQKHTRSQSEPNPPRTPHTISTLPNTRFKTSVKANSTLPSSFATSMSTTSSTSTNSTNGKSVKFVDMPIVHYASWDSEFDLEVVESVDEEALEEGDENGNRKTIEEEGELDLDDMREFGARPSARRFENGRDQDDQDEPSMSSTSSSPASNTFSSTSSSSSHAANATASGGPVAAAAKGLKRLISLTRRQSAGRRKAGSSTLAGSSQDLIASAAAPTASARTTTITPQRERESLPPSTLPRSGSGTATRTPTSSTSSTSSSLASSASSNSNSNGRPSISGPFVLGTVPIPTNHRETLDGGAIVGGSLPSSFDNTLHSRYSAARSTAPSSIRSGTSQTTRRRQGLGGGAGASSSLGPTTISSGTTHHRRPPSSRQHHPHLHHHHHSHASSSVTSFSASVTTSFATAFGGLSRGERSEGGGTSGVLRAMPSLESFRSARSAGTRSVRSLGSVFSTSSMFRGWLGKLGVSSTPPPNAGVATTSEGVV
ncbi:hypothetical protein BDN72DRAFT_4360 [Pluteus cervinus]|uniref:Uncharacterized protein n=1 Tax=Pluteus cervinus TaxID=181527 RepID=A0ACD3BFU9_9AGAR|nr:hypothetical protein BDN72DRAFT_4360 [Pluteus cervinus]